jgi:PPOX class probable F420-dependent enzyme
MGVNQRAQIVMSAEEVAAYLEASRTATLATVNADGVPHLVAMWYGLLDGKFVFETKVSSQKVVNLRRNPSISVLVESGDTYDQLRGVAVEGTAVLIDADDDRYWPAAISVCERYLGPYEEQQAAIEAMMYKRIVVLVEPRRVRSWDHRKLGLGPMPFAGTTAH